MYIFRTYITTKDGTKIYARDYGKRAFRIWVGPGPEPVKSKQLVKERILPAECSSFKRINNYQQEELHNEKNILYHTKRYHNQCIYCFNTCK